MKGKEYINEKLVYEGDYLYDKKWNGKGYDKNGNVIYELINGNGKIKEYEQYNGNLLFEGNGNLLFEGEYVNGLRNGKGKEYNYDGKLAFEGEYLNNKKWNGKLNCKFYTDLGKKEFEGEILNGKLTGKVK